MEVRFFEGDWVIKSPGSPEIIATREEIMMVLEDIERILIKAQYYEGIFNTTITNIEMDSASSDSGLNVAVYVEQCTCPFGYTGSSCEESTTEVINYAFNNHLFLFRNVTVVIPGINLARGLENVTRKSYVHQDSIMMVENVKFVLAHLHQTSKSQNRAKKRKV